jgi:predicted HicB family RNase H-like nuclease
MMRYGPYAAEIEFDPDTQSLYGSTVNVVPGGFDFWGTSVDELRREFAASADEFEKACSEHGIRYAVTEVPSSATLAARALARVPSEEKAAASRVNGAKGGRPRKAG